MTSPNWVPYLRYRLDYRHITYREYMMGGVEMGLILDRVILTYRVLAEGESSDVVVLDWVDTW